MKNTAYLFCLFLTATFSGFGQNVTFSSSRGFYQSPLQLTLTTNLSESTIRYTIDGSAPTTSAGLIYTDAIPINTTTVIRAIGYNTTTTTPVTTNSYLYLTDILTQPTTIIGWPNNSYPLGSGSATAIHDYEMDPDVVNNPAYTNSIKNGLTSIPTMSLVLDKNDFWDLYEGETKHPTSVEIFYPDGTKEQFNCDLEAHSHDRLKRSLKLGFNASTNTNLLKSAPYNNAGTASTFNDTKIVLRAGNNRSWARNWNPDRTCYTRDEWYRVSQQAISGTGGRGTFVHLYVNGLYWGLYNPVERTDNGMLTHYFGGAFADWMSLDHDGVRDGDPSRFNYLTGTLINQDMSIAANYTQLKSYLDVSKFCDYLIVSWMMGMTDWPGNNFHGGNRNNPAAPFFYNAWDAEWSFDVTNGSNQGAWVHPQFRNTTTGTATIAKIWHAARQNSEFMQLFADRVYKHCFNSGALTDAASRARWALINSFINTAIIAESARWGDALNDGITRTRDTHWTPEVNRVDGLMNGNVVRFINALQEQGYYPTVTAPAFNQEGGSVATGFQLLITNPNPSGTVYYSIDGSDPKTAEGAVGPGATAYTTPVTIASNLTVKARIQRDGVWSSLHEVSFTVSGLITGLYINEFMASNTKKPDENDEFDDWIEIYNATSQPIDIGGLYITDLLSNLTQYQIPVTNPALTTIPAKGYLLLWADGQPAQGPLHVTIKLSKGGEAIGLSQLVGSTPTLIDSYTFGPQKDDVSLGRFPDGTATFKEFFKPTPGSKNSIPFRVNLLINEILAVNQSSITDETGEHDPWIELYNNNNEAVDIGGMYLSNTINNPSLWKIPSTNAAQTTIPAKGYLKLWADNQPNQGILHVGFTLSETGGQIVLADIVGPDVSLSDTLRYTTQTANVSVGRFPDASKQVRLFNTPTPGATNTIPPLSNLFINEFMASNSKKPDEYGEFDDWIELYNNGTQAVDVGGLYITDDLTNPAKYQIPTTNPALTTIPANGFLLIWADDQATQGVLHVGFKLSAGGEQIGLFQPNGTGTLTLDSRTFGAQVTDVSSGREQDGAATFVSFTTPTPGATNYTNHPPVVANAIPDQQATQGSNFNLVLAANTFTDPDADPLTHAASLDDNASLPPWLSFNAATRTFSGTPPTGSPASLTLKVTASDGRGGSVSDSFGLSIAPATPANTAPVLAPIASRTATVGQPLSFTAQATDADSPAQTLTYTLAGAPSATIHPVTGAFAWTPATAGTFSLSITVTDNGTPALSAQQLVGITVNAALPLQQAVVSYSLMNADNEQEIRVMTAGEVINLATLPTRNLNIRANTSPTLVGSVKMVLSGKQSRTQTETGAPYALFGDNNGNYNVWVPALGNYSLTTTPYTGGSAQGTAGVPLTVNFSVINQVLGARLKIEGNPGEAGMIVTYYPNPFSQSFTLRLQNKLQGKQPLILYDIHGREVFQMDDVQPEQTIRLGKDLGSGIYILQIGTGRETKRYKLIKAH